MRPSESGRSCRLRQLRQPQPKRTLACDADLTGLVADLFDIAHCDLDRFSANLDVAKLIERAGVAPRFEQRKVIPDPVALVVSLNVMRRNLTASQRAIAAAQAWQMAEEAGQIAPEGRRNNSPKKGELIVDARSHFAQMFHVGKNYVQEARAVLSYSPELAQAVRDGTIMLQDALKTVRDGTMNAMPALPSLLTPTLDERATRIRALVGCARVCIIETGRELLLAKDEVGHGQWLTWLEDEFDWTEMTATKYMQIAEAFKLFSVNNLEGMTIEAGALLVLAGPDVPESVREQAVVAGLAGQHVKKEDAEKMVKEAVKIAVAKALREALASYARQAKDETLYRLALDIKMRANRQAGELLKQLDARGGDKVSEESKNGAATVFARPSRVDAGAAAGMSPDQVTQAVAISNVPEEQFESELAKEKPPTLEQMADLGRKEHVALCTQTGCRFHSAATRAIPTHMLAEQFRLIAAPGAPGDSVSHFISLADEICRIERCCLVQGLERAVARYPQQFADYCQAFGRR